MNSQPLVSVLMTAYNREKYIAEAIESVIASTFENWELIIVDDCSTDRTVEIAREYLEKDDRIKLYVNDENLGDYLNRNMAASYAVGKYLKYLDADDKIYPHGLKIMVNSLGNYPEAALGLSFNVIDDDLPYPQVVDSHDAVLSFYLGKNMLSVGPSSAIMRTDAFRDVGGFSGKPYLGDVELWLKLASKYSVVKFQPSLVWWRQHEGQQIANERKDLSVPKARFLCTINMLPDLKCLLLDSELSACYAFTRYRYARTIWNYLVKQKDLAAAKELFVGSGLSAAWLIRALFPQKIN